MVLRAVLQRARDQLIAAGIDADEATLDAELLARHVLGWDRARLVAQAVEETPPGFDEPYRSVIERRVRREPVGYILGRQEFWGRDFVVGPGVLIPRPETELLVEEALEWARDHSTALEIVDVGTGSGCLAVTLALEVPRAAVHATDISDGALTIARQNAHRLAARVMFHRGSMMSDIDAPVDAIVSNPPYVTRAAYLTLQPEVRVYEPETALVGGDDGLDAVRELVQVAADRLKPAGRLLMEIGYDQADAVSRIVADTERFVLLRIRPDLQGTLRAVVAERRR